MGIEGVSDLGLIEGVGMTCLAKTLLDYFRVKAPVTWRPPHRAVREDFPHTVPQNTQAFAYGLPGQSHPAWRITLLPN